MAVRLLLTGSAEEQWRDVAEPWFDGEQPWLDPRPTVVLTPSRAHGFYLRSRLIGKRRPLLGFRFWTPSDARTFLFGQLGTEIQPVTQSDLHLLTRLVAERLLRNEQTSDRASLRSVAQDPGPFLRAYDLVLGTGWNPARDGAEYGRVLAAEVERELQRFKISSQAGIHRLLREVPRRAQPPLAHVLMVGFNATHWPLWDLLQAVCRAADDTRVCLDQPGKFGASADELWIGSWENFTGVGYEIPESASVLEEKRDLESLAASYEDGVPLEAGEAHIHFIATADLASQVRAIVLQALDYLKQSECTRLGIVFAEANALALAVAEELRGLDLPLNDGPGAFEAGLFETRPWQTWMELQEEPTVRRLVHWVRACEAEGVSCGLPSVPARRAAELLGRALDQSLIDDLDFLALQMEGDAGDNKIVADFLRKRMALPVEGTFAAYLAATREALRRLAWDSFLELLPEEPPSWSTGNLSLSRAAYLAWLRDVADSRERTRPSGNHFYGKIHLLIYSQVAGPTWSHLILTGLNEGVWPRLFESGAFGSRYELTDLNDKARALNLQGTTQGSQGIGHETVAPGHGHCLLPSERYDLSLRDLCAALHGTRHAVCLTAMTIGGGRNLLPSDFFNHAWQAKTGQILDDVMFRRLAEITADRCRQHADLFLVGGKTENTAAPQPVPAPEIAATRVAFDARRDPLRAFGPYEFAYAIPPAEPVQLPCKKWETALAHPAHVWLAEIVGVQPWPKGELKWPLAIGTWVHRWLAAALRNEPSSDFPRRLRTAADQDLQTIQKRARTAGIDLYPWWIHVWGQARSITLGLARTLAPELQGQKIFVEMPLPRDLLVTLPGCAIRDFALGGKIDLLLIEPTSAEVLPGQLDLSGCTCWVIDFKTGSAKKMNAQAIGEGKAVQIALYGLAVRALGAKSTAMTLHTFDASLARQVTVDELLPLTSIFRSLDTIHRRGIFGQSPLGESEFAFQPDYPITTRHVPREILASKWALMHEVEITLPEEES